MNVTSAVRDSSVTLPIMPKAPASVNVAALILLRQNSRCPEGGDPAALAQKTLDSRSVTKMSGNDDLKEPRHTLISATRWHETNAPSKGSSIGTSTRHRSMA